MRTNKTRGRVKRLGITARPNTTIIIALVLSLIGGWAVLANPWLLHSPIKAQMKQDRTVSPTSFTSPSKEYIYAGGRLVATEEGGCGSGPGTPGTPVATAMTPNSVSVSWSASTGLVDHYDVERRNGAGSYATVASVAGTTLSITDTNSVLPDTAYLYRVRAFDSANCPSQYSGIDIATTTIFTDDPLVAQITPVRAVHISELRIAVNQVRATANLIPASWTDDPPQQQVTIVRAVHIEQLRTKLDEARLALGFSTGGYTDSPLATGASGTQVKSIHINELRQRVQ